MKKCYLWLVEEEGIAPEEKLDGPNPGITSISINSTYSIKDYLRCIIACELNPVGKA